MALQYQVQSEIEALSAQNRLTSPRLSDQHVSMFGTNRRSEIIGILGGGPKEYDSWKSFATDSTNASSTSSYKDELKKNFHLSDKYLIAAIKRLPQLTAYYTLGESTAGSVRDKSSSGNNGTNDGSTIAQTGLCGKAYSFDGGNDVITLDSTISLPGAFTFIVLFSRTDDNPNWIIGSNAGTQKIGFFGGTLNINVFIRVVNGGGSVQIDVGYTTGLNGTFNLLVVTRDSDNNISASLNGGNLVAGAQLSGTATFNQIGKDNNVDFFSGKISHVALLGSNLSQAQITAVARIAGLN